MNILPYLQIITSLGTICVMLYGFKKFMDRPHNELEDRVAKLEKKNNTLELRLEDYKKSLDTSHEKHRQQHDTNEMFITVILSFIDFEIAFCSTTQYKEIEDLLKAKETLQKFLAKK